VPSAARRQSRTALFAAARSLREVVFARMPVVRDAPVPSPKRTRTIPARNPIALCRRAAPQQNGLPCAALSSTIALQL
jgi:hypothetical protein